jgi:hypothetical protein
MATDRRYKSRFRMADQFLWDDPEFKKLSATPSAQLLLLFLEQGPHSTPIPGVFSAGRAALAERKCWKQSVFDRVFRELEAAEFAVADWSAPLVCVIFQNHSAGANQKHSATPAAVLVLSASA